VARDTDLDGDACGDRHRADQVPDAIDEMKAAQEVLVRLVAIDEGPYGTWILLPHEGELFSVGLEQAATAVAERPAPANTGAVVAAAAVAEVVRCSKRLIRRLIDALKKRLTSNVPVVCIEAAQALFAIKELAADLIGHLAVELHGHRQSWTRVSAIALGLSVRSRQIGVPTILGLLDEIVSIKQSSPFPGGEEPDEFPQVRNEAVQLLRSLRVEMEAQS
jgi:hypothetical protein